MNRIKRAALAVLLALCVALGAIPGAGMKSYAADTYGLYVGGVQITSDNLTVSGGSGTATYDPDTHTLTLNNYSYTGNGYSDGWQSGGIDYRGDGNLRIALVGSNSIMKSAASSPDNSYGIYFNVNGGTLTISGEGSLDISFAAASSGIGKRNGIFCEPGAFVMESGTVTAAGGTAGESAGIFADDGITIDGGTFTGIGNPTTNYESRGIYSFSAITINAGTVTARATNDNGKTAYAFQSDFASVTVNGGEVTASASSSGTAKAFSDSCDIAGELIEMKVGDSAETAVATTNPGDASGKKYAYIKVNSPSATPSYTIAAADTDTTANKKYHYGDAFTIAVTVSGADFEGGEFTLNYDSDTLEVKTYPTGNTFADSVQTAGSVKFEAQTKATITDGSALAEIIFTVKAKVGAETTCNFTFAGTPKICYDTNEDSVEAATVTPGSVVVEPVKYAVTLTGNDGVTFVKDGAPVTAETVIEAIEGQAFTAQMGAEFDGDNYEYAVTLKIGGVEVTPAPEPDSDGKITIPADSVTIPANSEDKTIVLTVGRTFGNFTVTTTADYVTGWTLVTVAKADGRTDDPVYNYDGNAMYYVEGYNAYAYLVEGAIGTTEAASTEAAKAKVSLGTAKAGTIAASEQYDVNHTGKIDYSDALLTYRCYELAHEKTPAEAMEIYLRADANFDKKANTTDVSAIDQNRTPESA